MSKFVSGVNLTGHPLIIFQADIFLLNHPEMTIQPRKDTLFFIYTQLHSMYREGKYKDELASLRKEFKEFQDICLNKLDGDEYSSTIINERRNKLDDVELKLADLIYDLGILKEARMGIVTEPTW